MGNEVAAVYVVEGVEVCGVIEGGEGGEGEGNGEGVDGC